jgi:N-acetylmuramoyl-L-alanine amidase
MNVAIDIGHANNTGARGNGYEEHALASVIGHKLYDALKESGFNPTIIDFPELSNSDDLNRTIQAANSGSFDIGVSLRCDSASKQVGSKTVEDPKPHGAHVCYFPSSTKGKELALNIAEHLVGILPGRSEIIQPRANLAVLKRTRPVWVLCECGFITSPYDIGIIKDNPDKISKAILKGILKYAANHR